jgi:membrane-bound serine protease (ClpP class)
VAILIGASFAVILGFALRAQKRPLNMGQQTLIGASGTAKTNICPVGQVQVKSELWSAELAEGADPIQLGDAVIVEAVEGLRLKVHKAVKA